MPSKIEIEDTPYCYSVSQDTYLDEMASRVSDTRKEGALSGDALINIRKYFRIKNIYHSNVIEGNQLDVGKTRGRTTTPLFDRLLREKGLRRAFRHVKPQIVTLPKNRDGYSGESL